MKCVCGYEYDYIYENESEEAIVGDNGDEPFINSGLYAVFETEYGRISMTKKETVYICPKCGTLKIEV